MDASDDSLANRLPYRWNTTIKIVVSGWGIPNEDGRSEFFDVALAVAGGCFCEGLDSRVTDCSAPED